MFGNKHLLAVLPALTALLSFCPLHAQEQSGFCGLRDRSYMAYPVTTAPVIDGKLEKEFWEKLPCAKYFTVNDLDSDSVTRQTSFRIGYDAKYLYLGATMLEPFPHLLENQQAVPGKRTDRINFLFSKIYNRKGNYDDSPYIFLICNVNGKFSMIRNRLPEKKTSPVTITDDWKLVCGKDSTHWYMEARIPFASLGFTPADGKVYFNVRRDLATASAVERESMWSQRITPGLGAHSFGTLIFNKTPGNVAQDTYLLNAKTGAKYHQNILKPISEKQGAYLTAYRQFGKDKNWYKAEKAAEKIGKYFADHKKDLTRALIRDEVDQYYMQFLKAVDEIQNAINPKTLQLHTKNAVITAVTLNGENIPCKNGKYILPMKSGISSLEIRAEAKGSNPALKINLADSPETADTVFAFNEKNVKILLTKSNGYVWAGKEKKLAFRQNLVWHREYSNHLYTFIHPNVRKWGYSPGETMHFIHRIFDVNKSGKKADYTLIMEIPEGFKRINDYNGFSVFHHYPTKNIKEEKITFNGENYLRYTYKWTLPAKLDRNLPFYTHYISIRHESYKAAKNKQPVIRFRRIIDGNTTDIVNTIPLHELPPINGGKMKNICFPQYHNFMGGFVSIEQWEDMIKNCSAAGMGSFFLGIGYPNANNPMILKVNKLKNKYGYKNFVWMHWNLPLWGSGQLKTATRQLIDKNPDLHAVYYDEKGGLLTNFSIVYCMTKMLSPKYKQQFFDALVKDYQWTMAHCGSKNIFINDENQPKKRHHTWSHSTCFCDACKEAFFQHTGIKPYPISNKELVEKYEHQWEVFWKYTHKKRLLTVVYEAIKKAGGKFAYYHTSADKISVEYAKDLYDYQLVTIPGCGIYTGSKYHPTVDYLSNEVRAVSGVKNQIGQFRTYVPDLFYSSDGIYYYPEETKHQLLRIAAALHGGAITECGVYFSAGSLYYAGEATRIIAEFEDLFCNGTRKDDLAGGTFQYPDKLVLTKGKERLILLFNESDVPLKGELLNYKLTKGQKARIVGTQNWIMNPAKMSLTIPSKDVLAIYIK